MASLLTSCSHATQRSLSRSAKLHTRTNSDQATFFGFTLEPLMERSNRRAPSRASPTALLRGTTGSGAGPVNLGS